MLAPQTTLNVAFFQFINQSSNAGFNYCNRNASSLYTVNDILLGYSCAVVSSCSIALGLQRLVASKLGHIKGGKGFVLTSVCNLIAMGSASTSNVVAMRRKELFQGVKVYDGEGKLQGESQAAGRMAI